MARQRGVMERDVLNEEIDLDQIEYDAAILRNGADEPSVEEDISDKNRYAFRPFVFQECIVNPAPDVVEQPSARSGHRIACNDGNFYSFGGYSETRRMWFTASRVNQILFRELWSFNYARRSWEHLQTTGERPEEGASHSAILLGENLLVFGGSRIPFGEVSSNRLNVCNLKTLQWTPVATEGTPPPPQYGQAMYLQGSNLYVIGGTTGTQYSIDVYRLHLPTRKWEALYVANGDSNEPVPRYRHELGFYNDQFYILGGGTSFAAYDLEKIPIFNVTRRQWVVARSNMAVAKSRYPAPRKCHGAVQIEDGVYICGGYDNNVVFSGLWHFHLPTLVWTKIKTEMPQRVFFHSTSVTESGCMYVFGGVTGVRNRRRTNRVFNIWLKIPSLKEICWEAMLHYDKSLPFQSNNTLLKMGIPHEFVSRVGDSNADKSSTENPSEVGNDESENNEAAVITT